MKTLTALHRPIPLRRRLLGGGVLCWVPATMPWAAQHDGSNAGTTSELSRWRDRVVLDLARTDLTPAWFTSANWDNGQYRPWVEYLTGRMADADFAKACASTTDYCLRDVWGLHGATVPRIDWDRAPPLNWPGVHALVARYFRTGEDAYARKWLAIVRSYAEWSAADAQAPSGPLRKGQAQALLDAAMVWGGIFTALGLLCKGLCIGSGRRTGSPFAGIADVPPSPGTDLLAPEHLQAIVRGFADGAAPSLASFYRGSARVPNQRVYGLEALALLVLVGRPVLPLEGITEALRAGMQDSLDRYTQRDGGQLEQSFGYAQDVANCAGRMSKLPLGRGEPWQQRAREAFDAWWVTAAALATPHGGLPQVGNSVWSKAGRGGPPTRFAVTSLALPYSGYFSMRSSWQPDAHYLFFFNRRAARGHSMAGSLSIQVAAQGRLLLCAGGTASYRERLAAYPEALDYLNERSSYKTNVVLVDGCSQFGGSVDGLVRDGNGQLDMARVPTVPVASRWHSSSRFDCVDGVYREGYADHRQSVSAPSIRDVVHERQVVFVRSMKIWVIVDRLRSSAAHRYTQVWKLAPERAGQDLRGFGSDQIAVDPVRHVIRTADPAPGAVNVWLYQTGVAGLEYTTYYGEKGFGFFNPGPLADPVPALDVHASWSGRGDQVLLTVIAVGKGSDEPVQQRTDFVGSGAAGLQLRVPSGEQLLVRARAEDGDLSAGRLRASDAQLLVAVQDSAGASVGLVLGGRSGYETDGDRRIAIGVPTGFSWELDATGSRVPRYTRAGA